MQKLLPCSIPGAQTPGFSVRPAQTPARLCVSDHRLPTCCDALTMHRRPHASSAGRVQPPVPARTALAGLALPHTAQAPLPPPQPTDAVSRPAGVLQGSGPAAAQSCLLAASRLKAAASAACPQPYELPDLLSSACAGAALEALDGQQSQAPASRATAAAALLTPRHIALSSSGAAMQPRAPGMLACAGWRWQWGPVDCSGGHGPSCTAGELTAGASLPTQTSLMGCTP